MPIGKAVEVNSWDHPSHLVLNFSLDCDLISAGIIQSAAQGYPSVFHCSTASLGKLLISPAELPLSHFCCRAPRKWVWSFFHVPALLQRVISSLSTQSLPVQSKWPNFINDFFTLTKPRSCKDSKTSQHCLWGLAKTMSCEASCCFK